MIALDFALRLGISPLAVMQEMYTVHDRPSFSGKFMNAIVHRSGEYTRIKYKLTGTGASRSCTAWFTEIATGDVIEGTPITWAMVKAESWDKNPKWRTMPDQMFKYRAGAFLVRSTCPDLVLGMVSHEEAADIAHAERGIIDVGDEPESNDGRSPREAYELAAADILDAMKHEDGDNAVALSKMYEDLHKVWTEHMGDAEFSDDVAAGYMRLAGLQA